jgi:CheY-like chemotaxis protein
LTTWITALVVEDDALIRFDLAQTLEAQGYKTLEAADAEEAIAVLKRHSVFTDIQMPGTMDGLALSRYVRKRWSPTILVISSGHCTPTQEEMASGALFIPKPYPPQVLTEVLDNIRQQIG